MCYGQFILKKQKSLTTPMLPYKAIGAERRKTWTLLAKVQAIYNFVRDEIKFGYNVSGLYFQVAGAEMTVRIMCKHKSHLY